MKFRVSSKWSLLPPNHIKFNRSPRYVRFLNLHKRIHTASNVSTNGSNGGSSTYQFPLCCFNFFFYSIVCRPDSHSNFFVGNFFIVPGATAAVIAMLGLLHARRIYNDKKVPYTILHVRRQIVSIKKFQVDLKDNQHYSCFTLLICHLRRHDLNYSLRPRIMLI